MKQKIIYPLLAFLILITGISCQKSPTDDVQLNVNTNFLKYTAQLQVYDAAALSRLPQTANATVQITGPDSAYVYDISGTRKINVNEGSMSFAISPDRTPTESNPIRFNVIVKANGYLKINVPMRIGENQFDQLVQANMTNTTNPAQGISFASGSRALSNSALPATTTLNTPLTGGKQEWAKVEVEAGTKFYDAQGNQLTGSSVSMSVGHFDTRSPTSLSSFPGGFSPENVKMADGSTQSLFFMSAGFGSIDMTVGGKEVKKFDKPIQVTMSIDPSLVNPTTNQTLKAGDVIPIWSYSAETGQWSYERDGTVVNDNGTMQITFPMDHLTWINYDWYWYTCWNSVRVNAPGLAGMYDLFIVDQYVNGWSYYPSNTYYMYLTDNSWFWSWAMRNQNVKYKVYRPNANNSYWWWWYWYDRGPLVGESNWVNACGGTTITLNVPAPKTYTLNIKGVCPSRNNLTVLPSFYLYKKKAGSYYYEYLGFVRNGQLQTTALEMGQTYEFATWYGGQWITITQTINKQDYNETVNLTASICRMF